MRAVVIANVGDSGAGIIGDELEARGFDLHRFDRTVDGIAAAAAEPCDLLVSLGSDWSVYWDHVQPTVRAEVALVQRCAADGTAVLGICFGGQLVATALGGSVERAPQHEVGWFDVGSHDATIPSGPWMQWHYDRFIPPADAEVLACNDIGFQAFRLGRVTALQFHPEVDGDVIDQWVGATEELACVAIEPSTLQAQTAEHLDRARRDVIALLDGVLGSVHAS
jgi:GMP synthase-like glutamine amidotransferase